MNPVNIESRFVVFDGYFDIFNILISEDNAPCGSRCSIIDYTVTMSVNDGVLRFNPLFNPSIITLIQNGT